MERMHVDVRDCITWGFPTLINHTACK